MHCKLLSSCQRNVNYTIIQLTVHVWTCNLTSCEWGNYILHATHDPTDCNKWRLKLLSRVMSCLVLGYDFEWVSNGLTFRQRVILSSRWSQSLFHRRNTCRPHYNDSGVKTVTYKNLHGQHILMYIHRICLIFLRSPYREFPLLR